MNNWLCIAHLGTPQEALKDMRKVVPGDSLIAINNDHPFLYDNDVGNGPVGGLVVAAELDTEEKAKSAGERITLLKGELEKMWKWEIFDRAPGAKRD